MALNAAALDLMADAFADAAQYLSLHAAAPNASGSNETTAPRKAANWVTPHVDPLSLTAPVDFVGGTPNGSVTHVGVWSAPTGGVFYGSYAATGDASFNSAGEFTVGQFGVDGT